MFSSISRSRWTPTSLSKSASIRRRWRGARMRESRTLNQVNIASAFSRHVEETADHAGDSPPVAGDRGEPFSPGAGNRIEFGLAIIVGFPPFGLDPTLLCQAQQRSIDGALIELEHVVTDLLDTPCDAVPMKRSHYVERLKNHEVQSALKDIGLIFCGHSTRV